MADITSRLSKFNPFAKVRTDPEDQGEAITSETVGGGGHAARPSGITKSGLKVSHALRSYLVQEKVLSKADAGVDSEETTDALKQLLDKPHVQVPAEVTDRSHPLPEYFISSSHNTYLLAHQLYGESSTEAYATALRTGSRCVEIDAWDGKDSLDEPKVTHGYTLASNISFRSVCETIRDIVDEESAATSAGSGSEPAPILISLENHCGPHGQKRLAEIMRETWQHRLVSEPVRQEGTAEQEGSGQHVKLSELGNKIAVIVEYHIPDEKEDSSSSSESEDDDDEHRQMKKQKKETPASPIIPELAELGVYAQSVKPSDHSWLSGELKNGPHHHLINVSESGLKALLPKSAAEIARHNAQHLMRVYPKGTRISSKNLMPVPVWGVGAQVTALNFQTFDASMQLNEALFSGSAGYVLKPSALRSGGNGDLSSTSRRRKLTLHVAGATSIPLPADRDEAKEIKPYVTSTLLQPSDLSGDPPKRKTSGYKQHKLGFLHKGENPSALDPLWNEKLEWEDYEDNELMFLRILIKSDDSFAANPVLAVAAVRLTYVTPGWSFIRMLDLKGRETHCSVLVRFEFADL
ncbi:hypothetical protein KC343_g4596 [Hortaea werneckii]|uniref:Phosphoinositide phospholipase C n=1 Tax=Hortaea werneckii TaxID=91943 RepID=A0A3M7G2N3_HORWE|nr:hypothetical protein KC352_g14602 [Hortaea werneckii]KAI7568066.1 hypothetical protein KC317_g4517 [Hortaea werneckii]KAI7630492.1 hypothetical protein KC343_g4596 [Hortaea werneckii]KAI7715005.1 hypothetical protein KC322_g3048 [Hortaea werneckii]RMY95398.1 hypothetical protein D0864_05351 [Hortaea werneckii]